MNTFRDVFDAFGGATVVAEAIGTSPVHAQTMKQRNSIPAIYWQDLVIGARQRRISGVTLPALAAMSRAKLRERRA